MAELHPFQKRTALVLGAGASHPYGFPLGVGLKTHLVGNHNGMVTSALIDRGHSEQIVQEFRDALCYGSHPTIDILLERKKNLREVGAYFIAGAISGHENHGSLFPQKGWYDFLFQLLGLEDLNHVVPDVGIVTLNYDRSLEHFLAKNIDYNCPHDDVKRCHERRQQLRIIHAHGSLGAYPEIPYASVSRDVASLHRAAQSIRIVSDKLEDSPEFRAAQELLAQARHIIFLGFGYNERTLSALLSKVGSDLTQFWGTAVSLDEGAKKSLIERFKSRIVLGGLNQDCGAFLRDTVLKPTGQQPD